MSTPPIPGTDLDVVTGGMREIFKRTMGNYGSEQAEPDNPDLYIVYLGGNDLNGVGECKPEEITTHPDAVEFQKCFKELLGIIKEKGPDVPVLCLKPNDTMMSSELNREAQAMTGKLVRENVTKAVAEYNEEHPDHQVSDAMFDPQPGLSDPASKDPQDMKDWALLGHWSVKGHTAVANSLVGHIEEKMSDKNWKATTEPKFDNCQPLVPIDPPARSCTHGCVVS